MTADVPAGADRPPRGARALVVENDPSDGARALGGWLAEAGVEPAVTRPHAGEPLPETLDGYAALVVLGGHQSAAGAGTPWFPAVERLLRKAVRYRVPTLAVGAGAHLLATAHGGTVERSTSGPEFGARLVARRDVADRDPVFAPVPFAPDVIQWHTDEITELPAGAVLLATSTRHAVQAFRVGPAAWGLQFHIECDLDTVAAWAMRDVTLLLELGHDAVELLATVERALPEVAAVWRPLVQRLAALALGRS